MQKFIVILLGFLVCSCAMEENSKSSKDQNAAKLPKGPYTTSVRQQFEPVDAKVSGKGANWTALVPVSDRPGAFWVRAHAGIGTLRFSLRYTDIDADTPSEGESAHDNERESYKGGKIDFFGK